MDEQNEIKTKLNQLTKKVSPSFLVKDLGDIIYEEKISKNFFVNIHGSELMTTVLVVVHKKKVDQFRNSYFTILLDHYNNDLQNWERRTKELIKQQNHQIEDQGALEAVVKEEFEHQLQHHRKLMSQPGAVPLSERYLQLEDPDGQQLWMITVMKEQAVDYIKVLKKSGFLGQEFHYDL